MPGSKVTAAGDPRITRFGRLLRRTKLDELPQLLNVIAGHMSIIGPRPEDPRFVRDYTPLQRQVLSVRPGLFSPAILANLDEEGLLARATALGADVDDVYRREILPAKLEMDLAYVVGWRFRDDLILFVQSLRSLLLHASRALTPSPLDDEVARVAATYDRYRGRRDGHWTSGSPSNACILEERDRAFASAIAQLGPANRVLEIGCGSGGVLKVMRWMMPEATIAGCDLLAERLRQVDNTPVVAADARRLPIPDASIDLIVASVMLSSVAFEFWPDVATEMRRVARPGASILWYDMRVPNPFNRSVRPVSRRTLRKLFPDATLELHSTTLIPQISRALGFRVRHWYPRLVGFRLLRSHLIGTITLP